MNASSTSCEPWSRCRTDVSALAARRGGTHVGAFNPNDDESTRRFLERAFRLAEIGSVSVDRDNGTAVVRPGRPPDDPRAFVSELAEALRTDDGPIPGLPRGVRRSVFTIHRNGSLLSTCEIVVDEPGLLRLRHEALRRDRILAREFREVMGSVPGVVRIVQPGLPHGGALTIRTT